MGPFGSKVNVVKGQVYGVFFLLVMFFFLFVPLLLPGPWADLHRTFGYLLEGFIIKGQGHRGQRSNFCISAVQGSICMKLGECIQGGPGY